MARGQRAEHRTTTGRGGETALLDYLVYEDDPPTDHWEPHDAQRLYRPDNARWLVPVALLFVLLNGLDFVLTHLILEASHGVEANPVARLYVESVFIFMAVKFLYPATLAWRIVQHREQTPWEPKPARVLVIWTGIFLCVVTWNAHIWLVR
jgi:hypothetical protein